MSWNASQPFTDISLITPSHLLLPREVVLLLGAGTADVFLQYWTFCQQQNKGEETDHNVTGSNILTLLRGINIWEIAGLQQILTAQPNCIKKTFLQIVMPPLGLRIDSQGNYSCCSLQLKRYLNNYSDIQGDKHQSNEYTIKSSAFY